MPFLPWSPVSSPPSGAAGGDLAGSYPNPTVTATHLVAALPVAQGGTASTTAAAAFAALAPLTTAGDLITENATPAPARLAVGANGTILTVAAGLPAWAAATATTAAPQWVPADDGFLGANSDPGAASGGGLLIAGTLYLQRLNARVSQTVTNLWYGVSVIGVDVSGSAFVGLWDFSGTLLSGSSSVVTQLTSTGYKAFPLTTPQAVTAGTAYYAGILCNLTNTQPQMLRQNNSVNAAPQQTTNVATLRWSAKSGSGTILGNITLSTFTTTALTMVMLWA